MIGAPALLTIRERERADSGEGRKHYKAGNWDSAIRAFQECLKANEHDKLSLVYTRRCEQMKATPPTGWDGVWRLTTK